MSAQRVVITVDPSTKTEVTMEVKAGTTENASAPAGDKETQLQQIVNKKDRVATKLRQTIDANRNLVKKREEDLTKLLLECDQIKNPERAEMNIKLEKFKHIVSVLDTVGSNLSKMIENHKDKDVNKENVTTQVKRLTHMTERVSKLANNQKEVFEFDTDGVKEGLNILGKIPKDWK